ncbi:MAG TPA: hypothetical protein PLG90_07580 [Ignavibacteria bacterium]|nr:hypothetical protein [Ignavibacteria bacterium]
MNYKKFTFLIVSIGLVISLLSGLIVHYYSNVFPVNELLISFAVSTLNVLIGVKILIPALKKPNNKFFALSFVSMFIRMAVILIIFAICIGVLNFSPVYFTITFFALYFSYLILELFFIIKFKDSLISNI